MKRFAVSLIGILIILSASTLFAQQNKPAAQPAQKPAATSKAQATPSVGDKAKSGDKAAPGSEAKKPEAKPENKSSDKKAKDKSAEQPGKKLQVLPDKSNDMYANNTAEELLNMAADAKLVAKSSRDLNKVIDMCKAAEKKGLPAESKEFCRALRLSSQLQRGMSMGETLLSFANVPGQLPPRWEQYRTTILQDLNEVLKEDPEQCGAQLIVGRLHMLPPGNEKIAIKALDLAIKYSTEEPVILAEALKSRAELEKDDQKREELLKQALPLVKDNATVYNAIAKHWISVKRFDKALDSAQRAVKIEPKSLEYKRTLAIVLAGLGKYDEAEKNYLMSQDNMANPLFTQIEEAQFLASIHKEDKAIAIFDRLIEKQPISVLYYYRAIIYLGMKDYKKAMNDINQCLSKDMKMEEAIRLKAVIYLQQEKYDDSIRIIETLKNQNPNDLSLVSQLAYAYSKKGDIDTALKILSEKLATEKEKDNIELLRCKGDILLMYGRWADTIATYETILKKDPKESGVLNNYSWLLSTSPDKSVRNGKKSLEFALKAAELTYYAEAHILSTLGSAYAELGQFDNAHKWSNKAVEIATRERHERLDDLKKEAESYKSKKPWREVPEKLRNTTKQK